MLQVLLSQMYSKMTEHLLFHWEGVLNTTGLAEGLETVLGRGLTSLGGECDTLFKIEELNSLV